jgi:hypothetical protein
MSATGFANALTSSLIAEVVSKTLLSKDALLFEFDKFSDEIFCASASRAWRLRPGMTWYKITYVWFMIITQQLLTGGSENRVENRV